MSFGLRTYNIDRVTDKSLEFSINRIYMVLQAVAASFALFVFVYFFLDSLKKDDTYLIYVAIVLSIFSLMGLLFNSAKSIFDGDSYVFDATLNTIERNHKLVGKVSDIYKIEIKEHRNFDSATQFTLQVFIKDNHTIRLQRSVHLNNQRTIGDAISKLSGVPFNFVSTDEKQSFHKAKEEMEDFEGHVTMFEGKYNERTNTELIEIAREDSPYAKYAREAAKRILEQRANSVE